MQQRRFLTLFFLLLLFPCYALAGNDPAPPGLTPITLPGGTIIYAELADTPLKRAEGLMFREHLGADRGMLFTFSQAQAWVFWMKNTKIPLSIAFFGEDGVILDILDMEPCRADPCPTYTPDATYFGALEVNQGAFEEWGISEGNVVRMNQ